VRRLDEAGSAALFDRGDPGCLPRLGWSAAATRSLRSPALRSGRRLDPGARANGLLTIMNSNYFRWVLRGLLDDSLITSPALIDDIRMSINAGEFLLAFDTLCSWIHEHRVGISVVYYGRLIEVGEVMEESALAMSVREFVAADRPFVVWLLDGHDRESGEYCERFILHGLSNGEAATIIGVDDVGYGDVFDISDEAVKVLGKRFRFRFSLDLANTVYTISREALP
jgi:hypothetical protein